jgi:hypothetical protein
MEIGVAFRVRSALHQQAAHEPQAG